MKFAYCKELKKIIDIETLPEEFHTLDFHCPYCKQLLILIRFTRNDKSSIYFKHFSYTKKKQCPLKNSTFQDVIDFGWNFKRDNKVLFDMTDTKEWENELEERLRKLSEFLKYKNHGFCRNYLNGVIKDFFKPIPINTKKEKGDKYEGY